MSATNLNEISQAIKPLMQQSTELNRHPLYAHEG